VHRIVSTMQSATEWLLLLGAGETLVARTDYDRQPALAHLPSIGGGLETSPEAVAALAPEVVLGWRIGASVALARALEPFGIPVLAVEATDTAEAFAQLAALATLVGREARGREVADSLRDRLAELRGRACPEGAPTERVLIEVSASPPMTAGGGTWMSELLGAACLVNAFADLEAPWPTVALEAILDRQPTWILTARRGTTGEALAELRTLPGWRDLEAVRAGRVLEIDGDTFARAGPGMADWVEAVAAERERLGGTGGG
jgi:ABC-type Fe3+-hydroxamate transport system substrate-binding protein